MKIPSRWQNLFWDTPHDKLEWEKHKYFIIARFLNFGTMEALQWLEAEHQFLAEMPVFLASTHARKLDKKTLNFWKIYFGLERLPWEAPEYKRLRSKTWVA